MENKEVVQNRTTIQWDFTIDNDDFVSDDYYLHFFIKYKMDDGDEKALISKVVAITENKASVILLPAETDLVSGDYVFTTRVHKDENNSYPFVTGIVRIEESGTGIPSGSGSGA